MGHTYQSGLQRSGTARHQSRLGTHQEPERALGIAATALGNGDTLAQGSVTNTFHNPLIDPAFYAGSGGNYEAIFMGYHIESLNHARQIAYDLLHSAPRQQGNHPVVLLFAARTQRPQIASHLVGRRVAHIVHTVSMPLSEPLHLERQDTQHTIHIALHLPYPILLPRPKLRSDIVVHLGRIGGVSLHHLAHLIESRSEVSVITLEPFSHAKIKARVVHQHKPVRSESLYTRLAVTLTSQYLAQMPQHRHDTHKSQIRPIPIPDFSLTIESRD